MFYALILRNFVVTCGIYFSPWIRVLIVSRLKVLFCEKLCDRGKIKVKSLKKGLLFF